MLVCCFVLQYNLASSSEENFTSLVALPFLNPLFPTMIIMIFVLLLLGLFTLTNGTFNFTGTQNNLSPFCSIVHQLQARLTYQSDLLLEMLLV